MNLKGAKTIGVLLAGGLARRMGGGDKPLRLLGGRPLLDHVIDHVRPQVAIRRGSPLMACRWSPTASPITPARSPACWRVSIGQRKTGLTAR
jgi:molybdopterin-guanine dinucleotide biosynthesis protein A